MRPCSAVNATFGDLGQYGRLFSLGAFGSGRPACFGDVHRRVSRDPRLKRHVAKPVQHEGDGGGEAIVRCGPEHVGEHVESNVIEFAGESGAESSGQSGPECQVHHPGRVHADLHLPATQVATSRTACRTNGANPSGSGRGL